MEFNEQKKKQLGIASLGDRHRAGTVTSSIDPKLYIRGPKNFDFLTNPWARKEMLGIIGASSAGKTSLTLYYFKEILENSHNPNSACVFFSLEMTCQQVYEKWLMLVGEDSDLTNRLYVVENCDENGKPRDLTTGGILNECLKLRNGLGLDLAAIAIDHLQIIATNGGNDNVNSICGRLKHVATELNTLVIVLTQALEKSLGATHCDVPLYKTDAYGCSGLNWYASWIISIHQPLQRVFSQCLMPILAWAYVKIRYKHKADGGVENKFKLMYYDLDTGIPRYLNRQEMGMFDISVELVNDMREAEQKSKRRIPSYDMKESVQGLSDVDDLSEMDGEVV